MDELYHYGIMGQRWGVRRYQNPDGSLTEIGKKRYGYGVNKIKAGSTVRRVSGAFSKDDNPTGLYVHGKEDADAYKKMASYLPSVNPTYGSNVKIAKVTQYKFVKDSSIASGSRTIDDYVKRYGQMTASEYVNEHKKGIATSTIHKFAEKYSDVPISKIYEQTKESSDGKRFIHDFIHSTVTSPQSWVTGNNPSNTKTVIEDFTDHYRKLGLDAIVDPEDYSGGFEDPMIILNKNIIKKNNARIFNIKKKDKDLKF